MESVCVLNLQIFCQSRVLDACFDESTSAWQALDEKIAPQLPLFSCYYHFFIIVYQKNKRQVTWARKVTHLITLSCPAPHTTPHHPAINCFLFQKWFALKWKLFFLFKSGASGCFLYFLLIIKLSIV